MEMHFPTINPTTTQPSSSSRAQRHTPNGPPTRDIITTINAKSNSTRPPTTYNETNIHHPTPSNTLPPTSTDPHNANLNSPPSTPNDNNTLSTTNDRHNRCPMLRTRTNSLNQYTHGNH
jgi:hypothetical protein